MTHRSQVKCNRFKGGSLPVLCIALQSVSGFHLTLPIFLSSQNFVAHLSPLNSHMSAYVCVEGVKHVLASKIIIIFTIEDVSVVTVSYC